MILKDIPVLKLNTPNLNGIVYTTEVIEETIKNIGEKFGTLDYKNASQKSQFTVILTDVSHQATNFRILNDHLICDIKILKTENGIILESLNEIRNFELKFAPRGIGNVDENNIVSNYQIISIDLVNHQ